jgi:hypothetical protein
MGFRGGKAYPNHSKSMNLLKSQVVLSVNGRLSGKRP